MSENIIGRPSRFNRELVDKAKEYLINGYKEVDNIVPSVAGLSCYLGISKSSLYEYVKIDSDLGVEFSDTLNAISAKQEVLLINGGLSQAFSGTITKLMLANHGYSDKIQAEVATDGTVEHTGSVELTLNVVSSKVER